MYQIIEFTAKDEWYYPKSVELGKLADAKNYVDHTKMNIDLGSSRIGGPIIDYPKGKSLPTKLRFAALLDLNTFSAVDPKGLLPKTGYLIFFIGGYGDKGEVHYFDVQSTDLERHVVEHDKWFWDGCLVDKVFQNSESIESRYEEEDGEMEWDYFAGTEKSKIYGIYTHCQKDEKEIIKISNSKNVLLLQIGENFNGEGVWSVSIKESDLKKKKFNKCKFDWGQS